MARGIEASPAVQQLQVRRSWGRSPPGPGESLSGTATQRRRGNTHLSAAPAGRGPRARGGSGGWAVPAPHRSSGANSAPGPPGGAAPQATPPQSGPGRGEEGRAARPCPARPPESAGGGCSAGLGCWAPQGSSAPLYPAGTAVSPRVPEPSGAQGACKARGQSRSRWRSPGRSSASLWLPQSLRIPWAPSRAIPGRAPRWPLRGAGAVWLSGGPGAARRGSAAPGAHSPSPRTARERRAPGASARSRAVGSALQKKANSLGSLDACFVLFYSPSAFLYLAPSFLHFYFYSQSKQNKCFLLVCA